jgi:hypothetical protein
MKEVISMTPLEGKRTFGHIGSPNLEKELIEYNNLREKIEEWNKKLVKYQIYINYKTPFDRLTTIIN